MAKDVITECDHISGETLEELENRYNRQFKDVYEALNYLLSKDKVEPTQKNRKQIGFRQSKPIP